jgi:hypothetical protein
MADQDNGSWDKVEASESFQEKIGKQHDTVSGDMASDQMSAEEDPSVISMPDESLAADDSMSFREQLPMDDGAQMSSDEFTAAAEEQLEDEPE